MQRTWKARIVASAATLAVLRDVLLSATKLYNGLLWHLREEQKETGKVSLSMTALNKLLQKLPRYHAVYADTAQQVFREVQWAWRSFFALRKNGKTDAHAPGFRRKTTLSPLRYPRVNGLRAGAQVYRRGGAVWCEISLGTRREDGVRHLRFRLEGAPDFPLERPVNLQITYDRSSGQFEARLVVEISEAPRREGQTAAVDLGETWAIAARTEDGSAVLLSGRRLKALRRYWQKVRAKVKPPSLENPRRSRRYREIARKESRQVRHALHLLANAFGAWCIAHGVARVVVGEPKDIRDAINYGPRMNQRLHAWPWRTLLGMLRYKLALRGIGLETRNERGTSRTCPACGHASAANRPSRGVFRCRACGYRDHADLVACSNHLNVSPDGRPTARRSSGALAAPAVLRLDWHRAVTVGTDTLREPVSSCAAVAHAA